MISMARCSRIWPDLLGKSKFGKQKVEIRGSAVLDVDGGVKIPKTGGLTILRE